LPWQASSASGSKKRELRTHGERRAIARRRPTALLRARKLLAQHGHQEAYRTALPHAADEVVGDADEREAQATAPMILYPWTSSTTASGGYGVHGGVAFAGRSRASPSTPSEDVAESRTPPASNAGDRNSRGKLEAHRFRTMRLTKAIPHADSSDADVGSDDDRLRDTRHRLTLSGRCENHPHPPSQRARRVDRVASAFCPADNPTALPKERDRSWINTDQRPRLQRRTSSAFIRSLRRARRAR